MSICVGEEKNSTQKHTLLYNHRAPLDDRFDIICEDEQLYMSFEQYLITQFSQENLHFYNDIAKFRTLVEQDEISTAAKKLCATYLGHGGAEPVLNLNSFTRDSIIKALEHPTTTMFDIAYSDVEQLLKTLYITFIGEGTHIPKPKKSGFALCLDLEVD